MKDREHIGDFLHEVAQIAGLLDQDALEKIVRILILTRQQGGRLFILGIGGGAATASHAVNDFRKIAAIEAYAPTDNVPELTARANDEGWNSIFAEWLKTSRLNEKDCLLVFSVGGGSLEKNVSPNLVKAVDLARERGARIIGIVGKDGGYTAEKADACIIIPPVNLSRITAHTEAFQGVILHLLISHPEVKTREMKWESIQ